MMHSVREQDYTRNCIIPVTVRSIPYILRKKKLVQSTQQRVHQCIRLLILNKLMDIDETWYEKRTYPRLHHLINVNNNTNIAVV
jgi:hypothetical protein